MDTYSYAEFFNWIFLESVDLLGGFGNSKSLKISPFPVFNWRYLDENEGVKQCGSRYIYHVSSRKKYVKELDIEIPKNY